MRKELRCSHRKQVRLRLVLGLMLRRERSPAWLSFIDKTPSLGRSGYGLGAVLHQTSEAILRWFNPPHTTSGPHGDIVTFMRERNDY